MEYKIEDIEELKKWRTNTWGLDSDETTWLDLKGVKKVIKCKPHVATKEEIEENRRKAYKYLF